MNLLDSLLVEPLEGTVRTASVLVRVRTLPVLEVEGRLGEGIKRVLGLRLLLGDIVLLLFLLRGLSGLGDGRRSGLSLLLLLGGRSVRECLLDVLCLAEDVLQLGLVDDGLEVTNDVGELSTEGRVDGDGKRALNDRRNGDIGKGNALGDKEGAGSEVSLKGFEGAELTLSEGGVDLIDQTSISDEVM